MVLPFTLMLGCELNQNGDIEWQKSFGGSGDDLANCIDKLRTKLIVAGNSKSSDGDVNKNHGGNDFLAFQVRRAWKY